MAGTVGAVLAGGRGRRLGGAGKATLELAGRPLLEYPLAALRTVTDELTVVAKRDTALPSLDPDVTVWLEPDEPHHPLAGVVHALRCATGRPVLVCAADMPLVTPAVFARLLAAEPGDARAVVPLAGGRLQPVCALYLPQALDALDSFPPDARTTDVVEAMGIVVVKFDDGDTFFSANTPGDLARAAELLLSS
jgi:molybdopterin-guanine dinucleotide biosynthesis protein A